MLQKYDDHMQRNVFPPTDPSAVRELVGDGHSKVKSRVKGCGGALHQATHGWFMLVHPGAQRIVCATPMSSHEDNEVVSNSLFRVLPLYPKCNGFLMDRMCKYAPKNAGHPKLSQIKHFGVDELHAFGHSSKCKYLGVSIKMV